MVLPWPLIVIVLLVGMAVGSFVNVVIFRLPRRESVVTPGSHCLSCGAALTVVDLVPIFSYLFLRGRCRHCGRRFSPRYMVVELIVGLLAVACVTVIGPDVYAASAFVMVCILIVVLFIDLDWMIIPDELVVALAGFGLVINGLGIWRGEIGELIPFTDRTYLTTYTVSLPKSIVGMLVGAAVFLLIGWASEKLLRRPSMGGGDVKLAGAMGALLGPGCQFLAFFLSAVISGAVIGLIVLALRGRSGGSYIPFGPMLAVSGIALLLFPGELTAFIMHIYA